MAPRLGMIADGEDFFDRVNEREDLWRYLQDNHIVISGPRRLGKSSLLLKIKEEAEAQGLFAQLVDMEGFDSAETFIEALNKAFPDESIKGHVKHMTDKASAWLNRVQKLDVKLPGNISTSMELQASPTKTWLNAADALQKRLSDQPVLILIDEISVFLDKLLTRNKDEGVQLISWLRTWRQQSRLACRFLFSGSASLNYLLECNRLNTYFNDCHEFKLQAFKRKNAILMLDTQCKREGWKIEAETLEYICQRVSWLSPFYLNLLLDEAWRAARDRLEEIDESERQLLNTDVDDAYDRLLTSRSRFSHWYQRLERDLEPFQLKYNLKILSAVAKSETGLTRPQLIARLRSIDSNTDQNLSRLNLALLRLEEEGYVDASAERVQFISFLLRDYWRRNHVR